jgi:hypothetical protein
MARQAGVRDDEHTFEFSQYKYLEAFAKLVAAKATDEANARSNTSWTLMCKKMVEDERAACAALRTTIWCPDATVKAAVDSALDFYSERILAREEVGDVNPM